MKTKTLEQLGFKKEVLDFEVSRAENGSYLYVYVREFEHLDAVIEAAPDEPATFKLSLSHNGTIIYQDMPHASIPKLIYYLQDLDRIARDLQNIKDLVTPLIQKYEEKDIHSR